SPCRSRLSSFSTGRGTRWRGRGTLPESDPHIPPGSTRRADASHPIRAELETELPMPRPVPHALLGLLLLTLASPLTSCARLSPVNDGPRVPPLAPTEAGGPESDQELIVIVNGHAIDRAEFL